MCVLADRSTSMALNVLVDKYHQALQDKQHMVGLFIDLSRAFDTLSHDILLKKLYKYGIRGSAWNWVKSYFNMSRMDPKNQTLEI